MSKQTNEALAAVIARHAVEGEDAVQTVERLASAATPVEGVAEPEDPGAPKQRLRRAFRDLFIEGGSDPGEADTQAGKMLVHLAWLGRSSMEIPPAVQDAVVRLEAA